MFIPYLPSLRPAIVLPFRTSPVPVIVSCPDIPVIPSQCSHWRGNPFPRPRAAGASPLFTFASGGHLSFNSERKVRKNATKTYGFGFPRRAMLCREFASCSSRNRLSRVPLSVKKTVPPQLSATASLPLPRATVVASPSTIATWSEYRRSVMPPSLELSFRASPQTGIGIRSPRLGLP